MARIPTVDLEEARGVRKLLVWVNERRYGGVVPGIYRILARDLNILIPTGWLYNYLHMRKSSPLSRLQRETLATTWPRYDLDLKTRALLSYAKKLTQQPSMVEDSDIEDLRAAGTSRVSTKPRRSSHYSTTVVGWNQLRDCQLIGYQKERSFPKQPLARQLRRLALDENYEAMSRKPGE
jgi:hypothetical protein